MRSVSTLVLALVLCGLVCFASPASADTVWRDTFDTHALGTWLIAQAAEVGSYNGAGNGTKVVDASTAAVANSGIGHSGKYAEIEPTVGTYNGFVPVGDTTGQLVTTKFDFYLPLVGATYGGMVMTFVDGTGAGGNAVNLTFYEHGWYMMAEGGAVGPLPMDQWISFQIDADYATQTYTGTMGGAAPYTWTSAFGGSGSQVSQNGGIAINGFYAGGAGLPAYLDNFTVSYVVPEPSTLALLGTGLLGLLAYAWRKRK